MLSFTAIEPLRVDDQFVSDSYLWITTGTFQKRGFIGPMDRKRMLLESLDFNCLKWKWRILAYVIMDNHYHLVFQTPPKDKTRLSHIIQSAHSFSAYHWRRDDPRIRSRIWWNCWDSPIEDMDMLRKHINYVHANPRFHEKIEDSAEYKFSSYPKYLEQDSATILEWEREHPASVLKIIDGF